MQREERAELWKREGRETANLEAPTKSCSRLARRQRAAVLRFECVSLPRTSETFADSCGGAVQAELDVLRRVAGSSAGATASPPGAGAGSDTAVAELCVPLTCALVQVNSRAHVPQKLTGLTYLYANPVDFKWPYSNRPFKPLNPLYRLRAGFV